MMARLLGGRSRRQVCVLRSERGVQGDLTKATIINEWLHGSSSQLSVWRPSSMISLLQPPPAFPSHPPPQHH